MGVDPLAGRLPAGDRGLRHRPCRRARRPGSTTLPKRTTVERSRSGQAHARRRRRPGRAASGARATSRPSPTRSTGTVRHPVPTPTPATPEETPEAEELEEEPDADELDAGGAGRGAGPGRRAGPARRNRPRSRRTRRSWPIARRRARPRSRGCVRARPSTRPSTGRVRHPPQEAPPTRPGGGARRGGPSTRRPRPGGAAAGARLVAALPRRVASDHRRDDHRDRGQPARLPEGHRARARRTAVRSKPARGRRPGQSADDPHPRLGPAPDGRVRPLGHHDPAPGGVGPDHGDVDTRAT